MNRSITNCSAAALLLVALSFLSGCRSGRPNIDLDRVLTIVDETLREPIPEEHQDAVPRDLSSASGTGGDSRVLALSEEQTSDELTGAFLTALAGKLNAAKLHASPLGVRFDQAGAIIGFTDANRNMTRDGADKDLFTLQIDTEQQRLIATDLENERIHRDRPYRHSYFGGGGFWTGYMLGSMSGRHDRYYSSRPAQRPDFRTMSMARQGYARQSTRSGSARSQGGSRSFFGGK